LRETVKVLDIHRFGFFLRARLVGVQRHLQHK